MEKIVKLGKEKTGEWLISLSDEDFNTLSKTSIIAQSKIHYKKIRDDNKK